MYSERLEKTVECKASYNYCGVCGREPGANEEPNYAPVRYWDCDDGWRVGTICRWCFDYCRDPHPDDYAYEITNGIADDMDTDEDPLIAIEAALLEAE